MAMHRPSRNVAKPNHNQKRSKEMLERCVAEMADCANVSETARRCGITPWLMYYWKRRSEDGYPGYSIDMGGLDDNGNPLVAEFHEAWDAALEIGNDYLEKEAQRRAVEGYEEPVVHKGIQAFVRDAQTGELELDENGKPIPLTIRRYSDRMLEILLKARRPEKFRENMKIEAHVTGGVLAIPQSDQANLSAEDWASRFKANEDGKTIEGTAVYPDEMPPDEVGPDGLERRTGSTSVRAIMERKMAEQAMSQDPELEAKQAAFMKWYMEQGKSPEGKPLMQSGPRCREYNMRPGLTDAEIEALDPEFGTSPGLPHTKKPRLSFEELKALEESDIDPLA